MSKSSPSQSGVDRPAGRPQGHRQADPLGGHRHRPRDPLRRGAEARRVQPARASSARSPAAPVAELEDDYEGRGYGDLKKDVAEVVVETATPFRDRTLALLDDPAELDRILADGAERARDVAGADAGRASTTASASCPAAALSRLVRRADDRRRDRDPRPATATSCSAGGRRSATRWPTRSRRTSPCCRRRRCRTRTSTRSRAPGVGGQDGAPFTMTLRGTGTFRPVSPVVFVQVAGGHRRVRAARAARSAAARCTASWRSRTTRT